LSLTAGLARRSARSPFSRIISTAVAAGLLAGLALTAVQMVAVTPVILKAEVYEDAADATPSVAHAHADGAAVHEHEHENEHRHDHAEWKPENGVERTLFTLLADVTMGVGYGLLLSAALTLRGKRPGWRQGLLWGAAGYLAVFVAPSFGLPPELPGTSAAPLADRQLWWSLTAAATAGGIAALAFGRNWLWALAALVLLAAPHVIGAPQPLVHTSAAPEALAHTFRIASAITNAVFWLVLGSLSAVFFKKFE
jgi:cobalt transporter subunit CbtA